MVQIQSHNTYWYDGQGDCWREGAPGIPRSFSLLFLGCSPLASESIYSCLSGKWWWAACVRGTVFYGSRAVQNRINRRVSKETPTGEVVLEFGMNPHATTVRHAGIDYLPGLTWMAQELVSWKSSRWKPGRKKENMVVQVPPSISYVFCFQSLPSFLNSPWIIHFPTATSIREHGASTRVKRFFFCRNCNLPSIAGTMHIEDIIKLHPHVTIDAGPTAQDNTLLMIPSNLWFENW